MAKKEAHWLNKTQMAKSLGISTQAFGAWGVEPVYKEGRQVFFDVRSVLANREANNKPIQQPEATGRVAGTYEYERWRLTRLQGDGVELKNEIARGETSPIEIITVLLSRVSGAAAGELDVVPLQIKRKHPGLSTHVIDDVKRSCIKAQNAIAKVTDRKVLRDLLNEYVSNSGSS